MSRMSELSREGAGEDEAQKKVKRRKFHMDLPQTPTCRWSLRIILTESLLVFRIHFLQSIHVSRAIPSATTSYTLLQEKLFLIFCTIADCQTQRPGSWYMIGKEAGCLQ